MMGSVEPRSSILPIGEYWALHSLGSHGMQIHWIYRYAVHVGTSATSLMLTGATLPDDVQGPKHPLILHFVHAGLCRAQIKHIDRFKPSYYQLESTGLCRAQDPMGCKFMLCQITVTWWIARTCCNVLSSMALVHTGTKTEVARISKKFSHRLANFGALQGS